MFSVRDGLEEHVTLPVLVHTLLLVKLDKRVRLYGSAREDNHQNSHGIFKGNYFLAHI